MARAGLRCWCLLGLVGATGCGMVSTWEPGEPTYALGGEVKAPVVVEQGPDDGYSHLDPKSGSGCSELSLVVDERGRPRTVKLESAPSARVGAAALRQAEGSMFRPATKAGVPVAVRMHMDVCVSLF